MSGSSVLKDGRTILEEYGTDLDKLKESDVVGVGLDAGSGSATGDLHFYVNGVDQVRPGLGTGDGRVWEECLYHAGMGRIFPFKKKILAIFST